MEPANDPKLSELLREWQVPEAPASLDRRVLDLCGRPDSARKRWLFLLTGSVRIPVPVGLAIAAALVAMTGALALRRPVEPVQAPMPVNLVEFRPVQDVNVRVIRGHGEN
jgi:hypothetical protein